MAITEILLSGKLYQDDGDPVNGATVALLETGTSTQEASTTTDSNGAWSFTETSLDTTYDIKITSGTSVRYILWSDEITTKGVDTASLKVRGVEGAVAPIYFFADQADDAGDGWRIQASASDTLAIGSDKASAGTITDYLTITNGANAAASLTTILGKLTVGVDDTGADVKFFGATAGSYWLWDESADGVVQIGTLTVGVDDAGHDVKLFGDTASRYWLWDTSADGVVQRGTLTVGVDDTGHDVKFFGATAGSYWLWDESADGVVQIGTLTVGVDDAGHDVKFFGNTASAYMLWDTSTDDLVLAGDAGIDLAGNIDVDGTANLDAVDIDGAVQIDATFTSGVDGQGYDTKFFGDTSGAYILWDTSADKLLTAGGAVVDIVKDKLLIGGTAVTTTAAELNVLDAVTAGTVSASLGVVVDSNKDIGSFRNVTLTGELGAATLDLSSSADIAGDLVLSGGADGALQFSNAGENSIKIPDNQASALIIEEANNAYITFVTTDSSEAITIAKATTFSAGIANAGTIAAGTWNGTDVGVAYGGTGASSLTDGGVLLGSGTGAITAMSVLSDGEMIVGDGSTDPVAESGATLRTSIGVGTGDSPQFTAIELGHASDTTIARSGSGAITVEGTQVLLAGAALTGSTIDASADFTVGDTVITNGVITDSTGLRFTADVNFGDTGTNQDVNFYGNTSGRDMSWDAGNNALLIKDNASLFLGTGTDLQIYHGSNVSHIAGVNYPLQVNLNTGDLLNVGDSANDWTTGKLTVGNGHLEVTSTGSPRGLRLINSSTALAEGSISTNDMWMYVKDDNLVFVYKDATDANEYYLYVDMGSDGEDPPVWHWSQVAPS
jgi:hypothetical protein